MSTLDHVGVTVANFAKALSFYEAALKPLGISVVMKVGKEVTGGQYEGAGFGKTQKPDFCASRRKAVRLVTSAIARCSVAPADAFTAAGVTVAER